MKNFLLALISFVLGGALVYFVFPKKQTPSVEQHELTTTDTVRRSEPSSTWPKLIKDSLPSIVKILREKFLKMSDTASTLPALTESQNITVAAYYTGLSKRPPVEIPVADAVAEINAYFGSTNPDLVKTVWVDINDVMNLLGVDPTIGNPYGYDGFRFYMGKAINHPRPVANGKTTLIMVATRAMGVSDHEDIITGPSFKGVYNKFDPCPPPTPCRGTLLRPM